MICSWKKSCDFKTWTRICRFGSLQKSSSQENPERKCYCDQTHRTDPFFIEDPELAYSHLLANVTMRSPACSGYLGLMLPLLTQSTSCRWHPAICCPDQVCDLGFPCFSLLAAHQGFLHCCWLWSVGNAWGIFNLISRLCGVFVFCKYGWNRTNHIYSYTQNHKAPRLLLEENISKWLTHLNAELIFRVSKY